MKVLFKINFIINTVIIININNVKAKKSMNVLKLFKYKINKNTYCFLGLLLLRICGHGHGQPREHRAQGLPDEVNRQDGRPVQAVR